MSSDLKKRDEKKNQGGAPTRAPLSTARSEPTLSPPSSESLPAYHDSEPSSQPPGYNRDSPANRAAARERQRAYNQPASAASIAAILGPPPSTPPDEGKGKKRGIKGRLREWKESIVFDHRMGREVVKPLDRGESTAEWRVWGTKI
ncbi:hypothetical protein BS50DRAFT_42454 [Corynespora cassiicola Philippines]|uniref:Uncharacterized protein n=1 Tax=Corynespora cassiicola Philippines TaxID=1448308 RepID=A0A2T2PCW3_CORCC|nr:hypothetical protein BS50DRAFT_42454 [Corynespora cassiicola Philippines]